MRRKLIPLVSQVMDLHLDDDDRIEKLIQKSILNYLGKVPHINFAKIAQGPYSQDGVSDILGCYLGLSFAIEVKRRMTEPTPKQAEFLNNQAGAGGFAAVCRSVADVRKMLSVMKCV